MQIALEGVQDLAALVSLRTPLIFLFLKKGRKVNLFKHVAVSLPLC